MENKIIINYSDEEVIHGKKGIFLAGPTPRDKNIISWRIDAIEELKEFGFEGVIYSPENSDGSPKADYSYNFV